MLARKIYRRARTANRSFATRDARRIPFFEQYRRWKSFTVWKRTVKAFKFTQASATLRSGLFSFVTSLRLAIGEIRRQCVDVERRRLFAVERGETITLQAFLERQRTTQQDVAQVCELRHKRRLEMMRFEKHIFSYIVDLRCCRKPLFSTVARLQACFIQSSEKYYTTQRSSMWLSPRCAVVLCSYVHPIYNGSAFT